MNTNSNPYDREFQPRTKTTPRTNEVAPEGQGTLFDLIGNQDATPSPSEYVSTQTTCAMCDVDPLEATATEPVATEVIDITPIPTAPVVATKTQAPAPMNAFSATPVVREYETLQAHGPISEEAKEERDLAMSLVSGSHSDSLKREIMTVVMRVARQLDDFIAADVADALGPLYGQIKDPRVIGPILKKMQFNGNIQPTGDMRVSPHRRNHGRYMRVWKLGENPAANLNDIVF